MEHRGLTLWNTLLHPLVLLNQDFWTKVRNTLRGVRRYRHLSSGTDDVSETPPETINPRANFHVLSIAVDPEARRRGVGRHLMSAAEEQARTRDAQTMDAMVQAENAASLALFKRAGFKVMTPGSSNLQLVKELS